MTRKYDNFVMVFITDDSQSRYEPFRKEWLEGAESYRISTDDYNALSGLFNFTAIPPTFLLPIRLLISGLVALRMFPMKLGRKNISSSRIKANR